MGGKGGGGTNWNYVAGQNAYNAASQGQSYDQIMSVAGNYSSAMQAGWDQYQQEQAQNELFAGLMESLMKPPSSENDNDYAAMLAEQEAAEEEARIAAGTNDRNDAFLAYSDAAAAAISYVDDEVLTERANAALIGTEYSITQEQKQSRINDYFSTLWSSEDQSNLESLQSEWGDPEGFTGFPVTRGDGGTYAVGPASTELVSVSSGKKPLSLIDDEDDEDVLGG